jgi:hypothetical protein
MPKRVALYARVSTSGHGESGQPDPEKIYNPARLAQPTFVWCLPHDSTMPQWRRVVIK